jgi:hypothetical protein
LKIDDSIQDKNKTRRFSGRTFWTHPSPTAQTEANVCPFVLSCFFSSCSASPVALPSAGSLSRPRGTGTGGDGYISTSSLAFLIRFLPSRSSGYGNKPQPDWKSGNETRKRKTQHTRIPPLSSLSDEIDNHFPLSRLGTHSG